MNKRSDEVWLAVAAAVAMKSRCVRSQSGAVICNRSDRVVSTGYNGAPAGYGHARIGLCDTWCPRAMDIAAGDVSVDYGNCMAVHSEANALLFSARSDVEGGTMYTTRIPCHDCAKLIANSGLIRVVCVGGMKEDAVRPVNMALDFMRDCGIAVDVV